MLKGLTWVNCEPENREKKKKKKVTVRNKIWQVSTVDLHDDDSANKMQIYQARGLSGQRALQSEIFAEFTLRI